MIGQVGQEGAGDTGPGVVNEIVLEDEKVFGVVDVETVIVIGTQVESELVEERTELVVGEQVLA